MYTSAIITTYTNITIIVNLDSYAELNIVYYNFALKYNFRRVAIKALPVRYFDNVFYKNSSVFKVLLKLTDTRRHTRTLIIPYTAL